MRPLIKLQQWRQLQVASQKVRQALCTFASPGFLDPCTAQQVNGPCVPPSSFRPVSLQLGPCADQGRSSLSQNNQAIRFLRSTPFEPLATHALSRFCAVSQRAQNASCVNPPSSSHADLPHPTDTQNHNRDFASGGISLSLGSVFHT